jgi:hypothetical protein
MKGYKSFFNGRQIEVHADTIFQATEKAREIFKPAKSVRHLVHSVLCEVDVPHDADGNPTGPGRPYVHTATD